MNTQYEKSWVAVDAVIFTIINGALLCYLHAREREPFTGKLELLGGLMFPRETANETLERKLTIAIGDTQIFFQQFHTFTGPDRDPRERAISVAYIALVNHAKVEHIQDWHAFADLTQKELAFDHREIIQTAYAFLQKNLNSLIVKQFMPKYFPLNHLQKVYEIIENQPQDNRNFRKKMISSGIVKETKQKEKDVSHRPAILYTFNPN